MNAAHNVMSLIPSVLLNLLAAPEKSGIFIFDFLYLPFQDNSLEKTKLP